MWAARLRYSGLGIFLLGIAVGLLMAWRASHLFFGLLTGVVILVLAGLLAIRDSWRQTTPERLTSRGITPESATWLNAMDPGLRREYASILPTAAALRMSPRRRCGAAVE